MIEAPAQARKIRRELPGKREDNMTPGTPVLYRPTEGGIYEGVYTGSTKSGLVRIQISIPQPRLVITKPERVIPK